MAFDSSNHLGHSLTVRVITHLNQIPGSSSRLISAFSQKKFRLKAMLVVPSLPSYWSTCRDDGFCLFADNPADP
jgi:hypothetical protein